MHFFPAKPRKRLAQIVAVVCLSLMVFSCGGGGGGYGGGGGGGGTNPPPPSGLVFSPATNISTGGTFAGSVVVADFNGDGKLDIAVSNYVSETIAVFLNQGAGKFGSPILTPVQIDAVELGPISVGDFNEDGKSDLVMGTISGAQADIVLLGNGDGTFQQSPPIPNSTGFFHASVVDLNRDGHQDLVTGGEGNVTVYLGNGDGTFAPGVILPKGSIPGIFFGTVVGDFNGDKKLDIVANDITTGFQVFYAGNGDGTFQAPVDYLALSSGELLAADFNGDGKLDLMLAFPSLVMVALGNGDGTFQNKSLWTVYASQSADPTQKLSLATGDFDLDGKPDAVVGDFFVGVVRLELNAGIAPDPTDASAEYQFTLEPGISDVAVGDLNGDGLPDIVAVNQTTNQISVILSIKQ